MSHHYSGPHFGFPHGDARLNITDLFAFPKPGGVGTAVLNATESRSKLPGAVT